MRIRRFLVLFVFCFLAISLAAGEEKSQAQFDEDADYDNRGEEEDTSEVSEETYAREFPYVKPMPKPPTIDKTDRAQSRKGRAHVRIVHRYAPSPKKPKVYAKRYRTWMPSKQYIKPVNVKVKYNHKRKAPHRRQYGGNHRRRNVAPPRGNQLRRPKPPPEPADYDYGSEDYFPEETQKIENSQRGHRPGQKRPSRRKPGRRDPDDRYRPSDENTSVSFSNFIQHSRPSSSSYDYDGDDDEEEPMRKQKDRRKKKKKSKSSSKKIRQQEEDQNSAYSESVEEEPSALYESYPPYHNDPQSSTTKRRPQTVVAPTPIYGDGYLGNRNRPTTVKNVFVGGLNQYQTDPTYTAGSNVNQLYQTTNFAIRPTQEVLTQQNYQNQVPNQVHVGYKQPNEQVVNNYNTPVNYNPNYLTSSLTSSVPSSATRPVYNSVSNLGNGYSSKYRATSFFDNTDTFQDFNNNVNYQQNNVNVQPTRKNHFIPSHQYNEEPEENDFINRHLDLYSNGVKGVPVQGDGYVGTQQESRTKDYDIGFGEIQYDETHQT